MRLESTVGRDTLLYGAPLAAVRFNWQMRSETKEGWTDEKRSVPSRSQRGRQSETWRPQQPQSPPPPEQQDQPIRDRWGESQKNLRPLVWGLDPFIAGLGHGARGLPKVGEETLFEGMVIMDPGRAKSDGDLLGLPGGSGEDNREGGRGFKPAYFLRVSENIT